MTSKVHIFTKQIMYRRRIVCTAGRRSIMTAKTTNKQLMNWKNIFVAFTLGGAALGFKKQQSKDKDKLYSVSEIEQHTSADKGVWVTHNGNVYDITEFVDDHPGGNRIKMAAGSSLEPFFMLFTAHKSEDVKSILDSMKIGKIGKNDEETLLCKSQNIIKSMEYDNEPIPDPRLNVKFIQPFVAEMPLDFISSNFVTPNEIFYVRNHFAVPEIGSSEYVFTINVDKDEISKLSLNDIKSKFKKHEIMAVLQCTANKRTNMSQFKTINGVKVGPGFMSNAKWGGVLLSDVLNSLGVSQSSNDIKHIHFIGKDKDVTENQQYETSIPIDIALDKNCEVLLAYEMNGEELPLNHGYPLRVLVPGVTGARSVKWLDKIVLSKHESQTLWQLKDYRKPAFSLGSGIVDMDKAPFIYKMPVNSAICDPQAGTDINKENNSINVSGYAYSGGGNAIVNVEVSVDCGETWYRVEHIEPDGSVLYKTWTWTLWNITLPIPDESKQNGQLEILCRATDASHNVQPETVKGIWNARGFLNNSWHKVTVNIN